MAKRSGAFKELFLFMKEHRTYWLAPIIVVALLMAGLMLLATLSPSVAPFIYTLF